MHVTSVLNGNVDLYGKLFILKLLVGHGGQMFVVHRIDVEIVVLSVWLVSILFHFTRLTRLNKYLTRLNLSQ